MKRLDATMKYIITYRGSFEVPDDISLEEAIKHFNKCLQDLPLGLFEYVSESKSLDEENCHFHK